MTSAKKADFVSLCSYLGSVRSAILSAHISPDADAIGATFALALGLKSLGKRVVIYFADPVPERMASLAAPVPCVGKLPEEPCQAVIVVDTASKKRVGHEFEALCAKGESVVVIDHHVSNDKWGDLNYIDSDKPSSSAIVLEILEQLGVRIDVGIANLLFAGHMEDTGAFRFSNTNEDAFETAARLVRHGAQPEVVSNALYFSLPQRVLKTRAKALDTLEMYQNGRIASVVISKGLLDSLGARAEDTEGIVDEVRSIAGTICAVLFREIENGWKLSLRSKVPDLDVNLVASKFGGGGHRAAAGCTITGSITEVKKQLLAELEPAVIALESKCQLN